MSLQYREHKLQRASFMYKNHDYLSLERHKILLRNVCSVLTFYLFTSEYLIVMLNSFIASMTKKILILQSDTKAELFPIKVKQK